MNNVAGPTAEKQLLELSKYEEIGVTHCRLLSARDERSTEIEKWFDGKRLTLNEARSLITKHGLDIQRSVFQAEIEF